MAVSSLATGRCAELQIHVTEAMAMVTEQRELIARLEQDLSTIQSIQRPDAEVSPLCSLPPHHPLRAPSLGFACSLHLEAQFGQRQASSSWHKNPSGAGLDLCPGSPVQERGQGLSTHPTTRGPEAQRSWQAGAQGPLEVIT